MLQCAEDGVEEGRAVPSCSRDGGRGPQVAALELVNELPRISNRARSQDQDRAT